MNFEVWQWSLLALGALLAGFSKTGIPGIGGLFVVIFASLMPARQATGVALPLLLFGDVFGVLLYRRHAQWPQIWRFLPWAVVGVVAGWLTLGRISDTQAAKLVGLIIGGLTALHLWARQARVAAATTPGAPAMPKTGALGLLAGFSTIIANSAGPLVALYLLAARLTKLEFVGTGAIFFLFISSFKVPFLMELGLINAASLSLDLRLLPFLLIGLALGPMVLKRIDQQKFELVTLALTALAALHLLLR